MARSYRRDSRGRFSGGGGGKPKATGGTLGARSSLRRSSAKAAANPSPQQRGAVTRGTKKLATARSEAKRQMPAAPRPTGTISKRPKGDRVMETTAMPRSSSRPPGQGPMATALRSTLRDMARLDAARIREIESITGMPIRRTGSTSQRASLPGTGGRSGKVSDALRGSLRQLAQSDARMVREMQGMMSEPSRGQLRGTSGKAKQMTGSKRKRK